MKRQTFLWLLLGLLMLAIPLSMLARHEWVRRHGTEFRLRMVPVDPADLLRGRYLALRFELEDISTMKAPFSGDSSAQLYGELESDAAGFAHWRSLAPTRPETTAYVRVAWESWNSKRVQFPVRRYYLNEHQAPVVEQAVREALANPSTAPLDVYVVARVYRGTVVLTQLVVGDHSY